MNPPDWVGAQPGRSAVGSGEVQSVTGTCRFTASERASSVAVTRSFAAAAIAFVRWNSMKLGTAKPRTIPATAIVIISSQTVNPRVRLGSPMERDYIAHRSCGECPCDGRSPDADERRESGAGGPWPPNQPGHVNGLPGPTCATRGRPV